MAGKLDSPLYACSGSTVKSAERHWSRVVIWKAITSNRPAIQYAGYALKWDGEWQVTFETFRDIGIAYGVGLLLIYLLVVRSSSLTSCRWSFMAPIPLTIIGRNAGTRVARCAIYRDLDDWHDRAGRHHRAQFNFAGGLRNLQLHDGMALQQAVITAAGARAKPIILTGLAACWAHCSMLG